MTAHSRGQATCAGKKLNVLSFGDEADEEEADEAEAAVRFRSAHETLHDDARLQPAEVGVHDAHVAELQARLAHERVRLFVCCKEL